MRRRLLGGGSPDITYEFINLGLSVDWCTCNIGANKPEKYGWFFTWGDTTPYNSDRMPVNKGSSIVFNWENYPHCNGSSSSLTKYCDLSSYGTVDNKTVLELEDDAANVYIGNDYRIPTKEEFNELINACNIEWITNYNDTGINGSLFTLKTDSSKTLFFPATGYLGDIHYYNSNSFGYYWLNSILNSYPIDAWHLHFYSGYCSPNDYNARYLGFPIRAVKPKPIINGYEYVDMGLSVKWATCNIGATKPEESGEYVEGYYDAYSKRDVTPDIWGSPWRTPKREEFEELVRACNITWTTINDTNGLLFKLKTDESKQLFFPAAGNKNPYYYVEDFNSSGYYWTTSIDNVSGYKTIYMYFYNDALIRYYQGDIVSSNYMLNIRPVC